MTGLPKHRVRYSLKIMEQQGIIIATSDGATVSDGYDEFMERMILSVDALADKVVALRDSLRRRPPEHSQEPERVRRVRRHGRLEPRHVQRLDVERPQVRHAPHAGARGARLQQYPPEPVRRQPPPGPAAPHECQRVRQLGVRAAVERDHGQHRGPVPDGAVQAVAGLAVAHPAHHRRHGGAAGELVRGLLPGYAPEAQGGVAGHDGAARPRAEGRVQYADRLRADVVQGVGRVHGPPKPGPLISATGGGPRRPYLRERRPASGFFTDVGTGTNPCKTPHAGRLKRPRTCVRRPRAFRWNPPAPCKMRPNPLRSTPTPTPRPRTTSRSPPSPPPPRGQGRGARMRPLCPPPRRECKEAAETERTASSLTPSMPWPSASRIWTRDVTPPNQC